MSRDEHVQRDADRTRRLVAVIAENETDPSSLARRIREVRVRISSRSAAPASAWASAPDGDRGDGAGAGDRRGRSMRAKPTRSGRGGRRRGTGEELCWSFGGSWLGSTRTGCFGGISSSWWGARRGRTPH